MKRNNEPIGKVECPYKGCTEQCDVYRYRERGDSEKSIANRRFAGKLYAKCPQHGKFGGDASDKKTQDYILEHGQIWGQKNAAGETPAGKSAAPSSATPASSSTSPARVAPKPPPSSTPRAPARTPAPELAIKQGWPWD